MNRCIKTIGGVLLAFVLFLFAGITAFAYTPIDALKTGSLTVSITDGKSIGTELTLYQVADVAVDNADQQYVLTEDFTGCGPDLASLDDPEGLAKDLSAYVSEYRPAGTTKPVTTDGSVTFDDLPLGLYLVLQKNVQPGNTIVNPFVASVPRINEKGEWEYDVDASPKAGTYELTDVTVKKVWNDGNDIQNRPAFISVTLYDGETAVDTVTLSEADGWSYTWRDLSQSDGYSVREAEVSGYLASYSENGDGFTVTNTPKLPQTGQLNWPVPVLAGGGVVLFAIGWALFKEEKRCVKKWD